MKSPLGIIMIACISGLTLIAVSLLWPRFMDKKRPDILQTVRDNVISTNLGKNAEKILGVENETNIQPFSLNQIAASVSGAILSTVGEKTKDIIAQQVSIQVMNQYQQMSPKEQQIIRDFVCKQASQ